MSFKCVAHAAAWHSENEVVSSRPAIWSSFSRTARLPSRLVSDTVCPVHVEPHRTAVDLADCVGAGKLLVAPDIGAAHGVLHALVRRLRHDVVREPNGPQHFIHDPLFSEQGDLRDSLAGP